MRRSVKKKAQGGMGAAILVGIIAGLIALYVIFLPSPERELLLEGDIESTKSDEKLQILVQEFVGTLDVGTDLEDQKDISNVFLFESTNAQVLGQTNPFTVRKGWFDEKTKSMEFRVKDNDNTNNVFLTFTATELKGTLIVELNGNRIFSSQLGSANVNPIKLEQDLLQSVNTLTFSVSGVGMAFWRTNEYGLDNVKVIGDITDRANQESRNVFFLSESEYDNVEEAELRFIPYCTREDRVGALDVLVNNRIIFSAVPVCEDPYKETIPSGLLNEGENKVVFRTNKGSYSIEQIFVDVEYESTRQETFFFELNETKFEEIIDDDEQVRLIMEFVNDDRDKRGVVNVNGHFKSFDQEEKEYVIRINPFIEEGNNYVRIEPETELHIVELRVEIEDD